MKCSIKCGAIRMYNSIFSRISEGMNSGQEPYRSGSKILAGIGPLVALGIVAVNHISGMSNPGIDIGAVVAGAAAGGLAYATYKVNDERVYYYRMSEKELDILRSEWGE